MSKIYNKFEKSGKLQAGNNKKYLKLGIIILTGLIGIQATFFLPGCSGTKNGGYSAGPVNYKNRIIQMTDVDSYVENGKIRISISDIVNNNIVYTEYSNGNYVIPLMAYVAPGGRLVAAISICEPCNSRKFFIDDRALVCSTCYTRWELDGMKPISGGCQNYPPDEQKYEIEESFLVLDELIISSWTPRSF